MPRSIFVTAAALLAFLAAPVLAQHYTVVPHQQRVPVGGILDVDILLTELTIPVEGYSCELAFDESALMELSNVQGSFLPFPTYFGIINNPSQIDYITCGALDLVTFGGTQGPGSGSGIIATFSFQVLTAGPIHLNLDNGDGLSGPHPGNVLVVNGQSVHPTHTDALVEAFDPGNPNDFLDVHGVPNPGHTINLDIHHPNHAGHVAVTLASLGTSGISTFGQMVPLTQDFVFNLSLNGTAPFRNTFTQLDPSGFAQSYFDIPNIAGLAGFTVYFASVIVPPTAPPLVISTSTHVEILNP